MRIWVTRTEPGAGRLASALRREGHGVLLAPVLAIVPTGAPPPAGGFDFVLFVSEHAVHNAVAGGWRQAEWADCPSAAIGDVGEAALRNVGVAPCLAGLRDAAGVVAALPAAPDRSLIVKGEDGRQVVQNWLRRQGGSVREWNVYRRRRRTPGIGDQAIDAIVAGSGDGVSAIAEVWLGGRRDPGVRLLVPSPRVARQAVGLGFHNIVVTLGAKPSSVVAALRRGETAPVHPAATSRFLATAGQYRRR